MWRARSSALSIRASTPSRENLRLRGLSAVRVTSVTTIPPSSAPGNVLNGVEGKSRYWRAPMWRLLASWFCRVRRVFNHWNAMARSPGVNSDPDRRARQRSGRE
ncbi:hypothetical protein KCP70_02565 [Salmonella enterica subsp. enterica]|nr:hypothetical protein KCP70_02565 [Salmonella enterica subsp. enterica]